MPDTPARTTWPTAKLRQGRRVGRTLYHQQGPEPSEDDPIIGMVDTPELAATIVAAVNGQPDLSTSHKEAHHSQRTTDEFLDEPVLPQAHPGSVKTFREMFAEALDTSQSGDREGADHLVNEVSGHLGRRIAHLVGERDGVLALLRRVQTILDRWDALHEVPHDHKCMYAVVEIQKLLNPREEDVEP